MRPIFIMISVFTTLALFAGVKDHLRPDNVDMSNMPPYQQIKGIDCIYVINLDSRPEKYKDTIERLSPYGIVPCRFSAIDGRKLPWEVINDVGVKYDPNLMKIRRMATTYPQETFPKEVHEIMSVPGKTYFSHCMGFAPIAIGLSHLSVLQHAMNNGFKTILVLEDDIKIEQDPHILTDKIEALDRLVGPEGWSILFTDADTKDKKGNPIPCYSYAPRPDFAPNNPKRFAQRQEISPDFKKVGARYGGYSMIIRVNNSGIQELFQFLTTQGIYLPYDMEYTTPNQMRLYCLTNEVISTQPQALSDNGSS